MIGGGEDKVWVFMVSHLAIEQIRVILSNNDTMSFCASKFQRAL